MGIITKEVEIKMNTKTVEHYKSLGYKIPMKKATELSKKSYHKEYVYDFNTTIKVKVEHLTKGCKASVDVLCDLCKKNIMPVSYQVYYKRIEQTGSYVCKECALKKQQLTSIKKYGVPYYTCTDEFKMKVSETFLNKYGYMYISQSPIIKEKKARTFYANSSQKSSCQQRYICKLYQGELNFPIKYYSADIFLPDDDFVVEFDGGGHLLNVSMGYETEEEHIQKEIVRYNVFKREGYKQMRIVSSTDKLPSDVILLQMLSQAKEYFSNYPNHSWIEYNIDTSTVRNAEHKDGVFFDFGDLRKIKEVA